MTAAAHTPVLPAPRLPAEDGGLSARIRTLADAPGSLTVEGPGGTGKSVLLRELADAHRRAGRTVVDIAGFAAAAGSGADVAVLVDDAQHLGPDDAGRVRRLLESPGTAVVVAYRPWPRPEPLVDLISSMGRERRLVVLGHADRGTVAGWARAVLGAAATPELVDVVVHHTGGLPVLVHEYLDALAEQRPPEPHRPRPVVPRRVLDLVRAELVGLDGETRALLHAVASGAPLDVDVLGELFGVSPHRGAELLAEGRSSGWLLTDGSLIPVVRHALLAETPVELTRSVRRRVLGLLLDRGEEPVTLARALARDHVRDLRAARLLEESGSAALATDPVRARDLLDDAATSGAPVGRIAARRAQAAALCGSLDEALQLADAVLTADDDGTGDEHRRRAAGVTATVLAHRGLLPRSAQLFGAAGAARGGSCALVLLGTGHLEPARAVLAAATEAQQVPTLLGGAEQLLAHGVLQSLADGPDVQGAIAAALSTLTRAATLLEPVGRGALLPDTPAALAALVALHCGELGAAESVLHRALATGIGGPVSRPRHHLLLAWAAMLRGRAAAARELVQRAEHAAGERLEPRDELYLRALQVGLARRESDVPAMVAAWMRAREAMLRYPVDLFSLLPLGELVVAGARLDDSERLAPHVDAATALLQRLGEPALWATPLHWSAGQAAIITDDPERLRPHAAALVAAARTSPYAALLAEAGRTWLRVLTGDIDAAVVTATAERLAHVGLAWDGSRLAGQAAARTPDARDRTTLLQCARALTEAHGLDDEPAADAASPVDSEPHPGGHLSDREKEVARLVVAGQTYREIGGRLFISAKTVEHHIARMRQRLGAGTRSDLLARLRAELGDGD